MSKETSAAAPTPWWNHPTFLRWGLPFFAVAAAFFLYAQMFPAGYVWDDTLVQRWQLPFFKTFRDAFNPSHHVFELTRSYYRPMVILSYMLDRSLAGAGTPSAASWAHTVNVLYHTITTALVYLLALRVFAASPRRHWGAFATALLFAVHPIHAESICNIAGRSDIFATLFFMGTALSALACRDSKRLGYLFAVVGGFSFFCGMISKEVTISAFVVVPALLWWTPTADGKPVDHRKNATNYALLGALMLAGVAGYFGLRVWAQTDYGGGPMVGFLNVIGNVISAFGYYVRKSVIPWPQYHYMSKLPALWLSLLSIAVAGAASWWIWKKAGEGRRLVLLSLVWLVATILPSLAVAVRVLAVTQIAERYLYLPSVGIALLFGVLVISADWGKRLHQAGLAAAGLLLLAYSGSVVERTSVWQTDVKFWLDAIRNPDNLQTGLVLSNLGEAYQTADKNDDALYWYRKAYEAFSDPTERMKIMANLGAMEMNTGRKNLFWNSPAEAVMHFDKAIEYLEPVLRSPLRMDGIPNASMGLTLLAKYKAQVKLGRPADRMLLERSRHHLDIAQRTIRDNPEVNNGIVEIDRMLGN